MKRNNERAIRDGQDEEDICGEIQEGHGGAPKELFFLAMPHGLQDLSSPTRD